MDENHSGGTAGRARAVSCRLARHTTVNDVTRAPVVADYYSCSAGPCRPAGILRSHHHRARAAGTFSPSGTVNRGFRPAKQDSAPQVPAVLVVDDEPEALQELLEFLDLNGYRCHGATGVDDALATFAADAGIGIVITDLNLAIGNGNELVGRLGLDFGDTRAFEAILVSGYAGKEDVIEALRRGAIDFLNKPLSGDELLDAVRRAAVRLARRSPGGERLEARLDEMMDTVLRLGEEVSGLRRRLEAAPPEAAPATTAAALSDSEPLPELTPRMWEVLAHVGAGKTNYVIACDLGLTENTVKLYVSQILGKTRVSNRTQLALRAAAWLAAAEARGLLPVRPEPPAG